MGNKTALVLSGGGAKGCWQAGSLLALAEAGYRYDMVFGVSVGAINAAQVLQYNKHDLLSAARQMKDKWHNFSNKDIWRHHSWWQRWLGVPWRSSVLNAQPLRDYLPKNIDRLGLDTSDMEGGVGAVSMTTGQYVMVPKQSPDFIDGVYASAAYPVAFDMANIDGELLYDGGLVHVTPLGAAIAAGATHVHAITLNPPGIPHWEPPKRPFYYPKLLDTIGRTVNVIMENITEGDLAKAERINAKCQAGVAEAQHRYVELDAIRPPEDIPVDSLDFSPEPMAKGFALGYAYTKGLVPGMKVA